MNPAIGIPARRAGPTRGDHARPGAAIRDGAVRRPGTRARLATGWPLQVLVGVAFAIGYILSIGADQDRITQVIVLLAAGLSVVSPVAGLSMFALMMPMREHEVLAPIRANAIMAGSIALGCLFRMPVDRIPLRVHPGIVVLLGYIGLAALSLPSAISGHPPEWTSSAMNELLRFSTGAVLFVVAAYVFQLVPPRVIIGLALAGAALAAVLAILDESGFLPLETVTRGLLSDDEGSRASGGFSDPNYLGLFMAPAFVLAVATLSLTRGRYRAIVLGLAGLLLLSLALSYSRGAYLGAFAGLTVLIGIRSRVAALLLVAVAVLLAVTLYPLFIELRLGDVPTPTDAFNLLRSEYARTAVFQAGLSMFAASPIYGVGFGVFHFVSPLYTGGNAVSATYSHNQYLGILAEQGLAGVILIATLVVLTGYAVWSSRSPLRAAALAMGVTYLVLSMFINSTVSFQGTSIVWLVMAAALTPGPRGTAQAKET